MSTYATGREACLLDQPALQAQYSESPIFSGKERIVNEKGEDWHTAFLARPIELDTEVIGASYVAGILA